MKILTALFFAFQAMTAFASETNYYKNVTGSTVVIRFNAGIPKNSAFLDWERDGEKSLDRHTVLLSYSGEVKVIRISYGEHGSYANFYLDYNNRDCLGYSGLIMTGPKDGDMCTFKKFIP